MAAASAWLERSRLAALQPQQRAQTQLQLRQLICLHTCNGQCSRSNSRTARKARSQGLSSGSRSCESPRQLRCGHASRQAAEKEVEALRSEAASQGLGQKRQKTAGASSEAQEGRPPNIEHYIDYDLEAWRRTTGQLMWRRAKPICAGAEAVLPRNGVDGALHHWRRGLVGAVQDWANGSKANVVWLLLRLMEHFDVKEEMNVQLIGVVRINAPCITSISHSHCVLS